MFRTVLIACFAACVLAQDVPDASSQCFNVINRRNQKDLYADTECHHYVQCFYVNSTYAVGFRRQCPQGSFWHDSVLSCLPEGETPCVDRCLEEATASRGCYAGLGCRTFYICANTGSYGMCCPLGTQFNEATCSCDESATCTDACVQQAPVVQTTVAPPEAVNSTVCMDSFGSYIAADAAESNAYHLIDDEGHSSGKQYCVDGYAFNLDSCRCDIESGATVPPQVGLRRAALYLPFDSDAADASVLKFSTFLFDGATVDTTTGAVGGGSLNVNGGRLEVPAFKTYDSRAAGSWCAFYSCAGSCSAGGVVANAKQANDDASTVVLGLTGATAVQGNVHLWSPTGTRTVSSSFTTPSNGWNHVCLTYDGNTVNLYVNGAVSASENVGGYLKISHAPLAVGNDQTLGTFNGHIDEVLVTPFAMTSDEVNAHRTGDRAYLQNLGFW